MHWGDRITRALRGDRAAGGGHYKASAWKQCKKQWLCWFLHEDLVQPGARKHRSVEYRHGSSCIAMFCTFCRLFDAHAADNEKAPGAPCTLSCSSTLPVSRSFSFLPFQGLLSPGSSLPHTFGLFDALKTAPDREKCTISSCITQQISNLLFHAFTAKVNSN